MISKHHIELLWAKLTTLAGFLLSFIPEISEILQLVILCLSVATGVYVMLYHKNKYQHAKQSKK